MILTVIVAERQQVSFVHVNVNWLPTNWAELDPDTLAEHRKRGTSYHSKMMWRRG